MGGRSANGARGSQATDCRRATSRRSGWPRQAEAAAQGADVVEVLVAQRVAAARGDLKLGRQASHVRGIEDDHMHVDQAAVIVAQHEVPGACIVALGILEPVFLQRRAPSPQVPFLGNYFRSTSLPRLFPPSAMTPPPP